MKWTRWPFELSMLLISTNMPSVAGLHELRPYIQGMQIGQGFNTFTGEPRLHNIVHIPEGSKMKMMSKEELMNMSASSLREFSSTEITDSRSMRQALGISGSLGVSYGQLDLSTSISYRSELKSEGETTNYMISVKIVNPTEFATEFRFNPGYNKSGKDALKAYGDSYIQGIVTGGLFMAVASITSTSENMNDEVKAAAKTVFSAYGANVTASAEFRNNMRLLAKFSKVEIAKTVNGAGIKIMSGDNPLKKLMDEATEFYNKDHHKNNIYALISDYYTAAGYGGNGDFRTTDYEEAREKADVIMENRIALKDIKRTIKKHWGIGSELDSTVTNIDSQITRWISRVKDDPSEAFPNLPDFGIQQLREEVKSKIRKLQKPFYAIAHRVLTRQGIMDALDIGANAVEIDATAWVRGGWWADWAGLEASAGDTIEAMFKKIAELRRDGRNIIFIWVDIKNPEYCLANEGYYHCSVDKLKKLARDIVLEAGVQVLYAFSKDMARGAVFESFISDLKDGEAISIDGELPVFNNAIKKGHRVMSYGYCDITGRSFDQIQLGLRSGSDSGKYDRIFGWNLVFGSRDDVMRLLNAGVDGLTFGFYKSHFYRHHNIDAAFTNMRAAVAESNKVVFAKAGEHRPW